MGEGIVFDLQYKVGLLATLCGACVVGDDIILCLFIVLYVGGHITLLSLLLQWPRDQLKSHSTAHMHRMLTRSCTSDIYFKPYL